MVVIKKKTVLLLHKCFAVKRVKLIIRTHIHVRVVSKEVGCSVDHAHVHALYARFTCQYCNLLLQPCSVAFQLPLLVHSIDSTSSLQQ